MSGLSLATPTTVVHRPGQGSSTVALANPSIYLEAFGYPVFSWMRCAQLTVANGRSGDFYDGKRAMARYFFTYESPKAPVQVDLVARLDTAAVTARPEWF